MTHGCKKKNRIADLREACRELLAFRSEADHAPGIADANSSQKSSSGAGMEDPSSSSSSPQASELERLRTALAKEQDRWRVHKEQQIAEKWMDMAMALFEGKETSGADGDNKVSRSF
jgi:hypothetical protein